MSRRDGYYGRITSSSRNEVIASLVARFLNGRTNQSQHILSMGCGVGNAIVLLCEFLEQRFGVPRDRLDIHGWDVSEDAVQQAVEQGIKASVKDISRPGLVREESQRFDLIIMTEILEHLVDTGAAIDNAYDLLKPNGGIVISTPNLASWHNRVLLMIGNQPHSTEVSFDRCRFGNRLFDKILGEIKTPMGGHLRVFTWKALQDFLDYHGFLIDKASGISSHGDFLSRLIARLWVGGAGGIGLLAYKKGDAHEAKHVGNRADAGT